MDSATGRVAVGYASLTVDQVNAKRSRAEGVRKFRVLAHVLTAEDGELTPTMKVKRSIVYEHHAEAITELYAGG